MIVRPPPKPRAGVRKRTGRYYTPEPLVGLVLDAALDPAIARTAEPQSLRVCDPACGTGHFLIPAARRLGAAVAARSGWSPAQALRHVVTSQLFAADVDDDAVRACRTRLADLAGVSTEPLTSNIRVGDALRNVFAADVRFDVIVGNPPYVNAIEGSVPDRTKARLRDRFPIIRGAADLSHYFLARAVELVAPGGRVGLLLPRGVLNSPACARLRAILADSLRPNLLYVPETCDWFDGAAVFAGVVVLGPDHTCRVGAATDLARLDWSVGKICGGNWWREAMRVLGRDVGRDCESAIRSGTGRRLGDVFHVESSLTTADAYDVRDAVVDARAYAGPKFVTTGLIDPGVSRWGRKRCRYLGRDFAHPRIDETAALSPSLRRRVERARRPKVLVAGLTRKVECFFDPGECLGAVSTFSIFHPQDDRDALNELCGHLLTDDVTIHFIAELGGNGMRGAHVTMKKSFLMELVLPAQSPVPIAAPAARPHFVS